MLCSSVTEAASPASNDILEPVFLADSPDIKIISELYGQGVLKDESVAFYIASTPVITRYEYGLLLDQALSLAYTHKELDEENIKKLQGIAENNEGLLNTIVGNTNLTTSIKNWKPKPKEGQNQQASVSGSAQPLQLTPLNSRRQPSKTDELPPKKEVPPPPPPPQPIPASPLGEISQDSLNKLQKEYVKIKTSGGATQENKPAEQKKSFYTELSHHLFYSSTSTSGNVPLDDKKDLDDKGNPKHKKYMEEHSLREELLMKFIWNVSNTLRITTGFRAYNDDGWLGDPNRQVGFDNLVANIRNQTTLTFGRYSASLGGYSVNTSNLRGVNVEHKPTDNSSLNIFYGKTDDTGRATELQQQAWGIKYVTSQLIKNIQLSLGYASNRDITNDSKPSQTAEQRQFVTLGFNGKVADGSISGEVTRANQERQSMTAAFVDFAKSWGTKLKSTLHIVNVSPEYDSGLVDAKKPGLGIPTYDIGKPKYPYEAGQRGFDLSLSYVLKEGISNMQMGLSNYSRTTEGHSMRDWFVAFNHLWQFTDDKREIAKINLSTKYQNRTVDSEKRTIWTAMVDAAVSPWKNGVINVGLHKTYDSAAGTNSDDKIELATGLKHQFAVSERTTITPEINYSIKRGSIPGAVDASTLSSAITIDQQIVPNQFSVALRLAYENHNVRQSEISPTTGEKLDGNSRKVSSVGLDVHFAPKIVEGLTLGVGYSIDNVHDYIKNTTSKQDVITASANYARPINDNTVGSLSYQYSYRKDKQYTENNELQQSIAAQFDISIGKNSKLQLNHSYEKHVKPSDDKANYTATQTTVDMVNKF